MEPSLPSQLRANWDRTLGTLGVVAQRGNAAFDELVKAYTSPGRYYHNLEHIEAVLVSAGAQNQPPMGA